MNKLTYDEFREEVVDRWENGEVNELEAERCIKRTNPPTEDHVTYDIISEHEYYEQLYKNVIDKEDLVHLLSSLDIEKDEVISDNLTIVLATYFSEHMERPEDDPEDTDFGWGRWVMERTEATIDYMADQILKKLK